MYDHILISYKQHISALLYLSTHFTFWLRLFLCVKSHFTTYLCCCMCVWQVHAKGERKIRKNYSPTHYHLLISLTPCKKKKSCPSRCQQCFFYSLYFTFFRDAASLILIPKTIHHTWRWVSKEKYKQCESDCIFAPTLYFVGLEYIQKMHAARSYSPNTIIHMIYHHYHITCDI